MISISRREFFCSAAATAATAALANNRIAAQPASGATGAAGGPVVIASANGLAATKKAMELLLAGADPLDAVVAGVNIVEEDPEDNSVGLGGLPNEDGIVELDASVMHGPTARCGAVAALRNIVHASRVAKLVMERTDHCMIVGEGALRFAKAHGFKEVDLLTEKSREAWLKWKENRSSEDDWLSPEEAGSDKRASALEILHTYGTINCCARTAAGDLGGVTTTSGLSYKIPGRIGDSPIIGAGLYVDNAVGGAGATGRGEANIKICGAHTIIEAMRGGMSPTDACLHACKRIAETTTEKRLRDKDGRPNFDVKFYALAKDGRFGSASIWSGAKFAVFANGDNRLEQSAFLFRRPA